MVVLPDTGTGVSPVRVDGSWNYTNEKGRWGEFASAYRLRFRIKQGY